MVENYRNYTATLRSQFEGERAHMAADRDRMCEVMEEERALWDEERKWLKQKIKELEMLVENKRSDVSSSHLVNQKPISHPRIPSCSSNGGSVDSVRSVPQESGRNADGSPFYAPAPRKPSRTFDTSSSVLRVDDITAPRETPIRVTSKELTSSDFIQSSSHSRSHVHEHMSSIQEASHETIDIQHIQPELEGVAIKASAVLPTFAARVLSPRRSPPKLSPELSAPGRLSPEDKERMTIEIVKQPENRRLTLHAGHTPSHSRSFPIIEKDESGNATPTQEHHNPEPKDKHVQQPYVSEPVQQEEPHQQHSMNHLPAVAEAEDENETEHDNGDKELSGPLGLSHNLLANEDFLDQLNKKLEVVARSRDHSPSTSSQASGENSSSSSKPRRHRDDDDDEDDEKDEAPRLKLKPSMNFGRPMGSM
jgi:hypothetical protein